MVITVENDGTVVIKAPKWTRKATIERFYRANLLWIASKRINLEQNSDKITVLTEDDVKKLKQQAKAVMLQKTEYYSRIMGLKPNKVKITSAKRSWGTCIERKKQYTVCYSYRNMFLTDRCQDYIVVHELAHIKHMDHSSRFFALVESILPDYRQLSAEIDRYKDFHIYPD